MNRLSTVLWLLAGFGLLSFSLSAQRACLDVLKDPLLRLPPNEHLVAFDEFSVCEKPTGF